jgi:hypothetical protein
MEEISMVDDFCHVLMSGLKKTQHLGFYSMVDDFCHVTMSGSKKSKSC